MANVFERLVLAKVEVTKGVDANPAPATDAIRVRKVDVTVDRATIQRPAVKGTMGDLPHVMGTGSIKATIEVELKGSGVAGTAPEIGPLFQACGFTETVAAGTSVTYSPSGPNAIKSATIYVYKDGLLWKLIGAVGTVKFQGNAGDLGVLTFDMSAPYTAPVASALPAGVAFDATLPVALLPTTVINDGANIKVSSFSWDIGNTIQEHNLIGEHSFSIANRAPTMQFTKDSVATAAEWNALANGTTASITATIGATAGNITTISAPHGVRQSVAYGERGERDTLDVTYNLYEQTSDDQISIQFT